MNTRHLLALITVGSIIIGVACVLPLVSAEDGAAAKQSPTLESLSAEIRELRGRVTKLERRIVKLETPTRILFEPSRFHVDEHGFLLDHGGRVMGIWGVDVPMLDNVPVEVSREPINGNLDAPDSQPKR